MNTAHEKLKISINPARIVNEEEMYAALTETERDFFHAGAWSSVAEAYQEAKIRRPFDFMSKKMPVDPIDWRLAQCAPLLQAGKASIEQVLRLSSTTLKNMLPLLLSSQLATIDSVLASEALHINSPHYSYFILILFNILSTEQLNEFSQEDAWLSRQIMFLLFNRLITPSELPHYIKDSKLIRAYMSISQEELDILILKCFNMADSLPSFLPLAADKKDEMVHTLLAMTSDNEMSAWYVAQFEMSPPLKRGGNAAVDDRSLLHPPATTSKKCAAKAAAVSEPHSPTRFVSVATQDAHHHDSNLSRQDMYDALTPLERELLACGVWLTIQQAYDDVKLNRPDDFRVNAKPTNTMEARLERLQGAYDAAEDEPGFSPEVWRATRTAASASAAVSVSASAAVAVAVAVSASAAVAVSASASASAKIMEATADDRPLPRLNVTPCSSPTLFAAVVAPAASEGANEQHQNSNVYPGSHFSSST